MDAYMEFRVSTEAPIPVRALDPVLLLGDVRVEDYRYENEDRSLVFRLYDLDALGKVREDVEIILQFGDDESTRTSLGAFRDAKVKER